MNKNKALKIFFAIDALIVVLLVIIRIIYGGGKYYEDLSTEPFYGEEKLEVFFSYDEPLGNVAVSFENRAFFTVHPESRPEGAKLLEIVDGKAVPYPSAEFQDNFNTVLGVMIDQRDILWTIDHGNHGLDDVRLIGISLKTNEVVHDHVFDAEIAGLGSFFNDLQVDQFGTVYIADLSFFRKNPALVIYDSNTGIAHRKLQGHDSVYPQDWIIQTYRKDMKFFGGLAAFKPGVDGIALNSAESYIYYGAMTHENLYRIPTASLKDQKLSDESLKEKVELVGKKPLNDGLSMDDWSNVFIADVEHNSIVRMSNEGQLKTIIRSDKIRWPDGLSHGGDGLLYFTDSALPDVVLESKESIRQAAPYHIFRFRPGISAVAGR